MPPQRTNMKFYNFNHAVYKGFKTIDEAIYFLLSGNAYSSCKNIPVHEKDEMGNGTDNVCSGTFR
jgi:hypothetical protein